MQSIFLRHYFDASVSDALKMFKDFNISFPLNTFLIGYKSTINRFVSILQQNYFGPPCLMYVVKHTVKYCH